MSFFEKGAVRIHYEEAGSGFPLLLIAGGGLYARLWARQSGGFLADGLAAQPYEAAAE